MKRLNIIQRLARRGRYYLGRVFSRRSGAERELEQGRSKSQHQALSKLGFLPWLDDTVGETEARRRFYRRMLFDDKVKAAVVSKLCALAALDPVVSPEDDDHLVDRRVADFIQWAITKMIGGIRGIVEDVVFPLLVDGHVLCEKVWGKVARGRWRLMWVIRRFKPMHPDLYTLAVDEYGNPRTVIGQLYNVGKEWPIEDFIYARHLPLYDNPRGMSDLAAAYRPYWIKDSAWKLRNAFLEYYSSGPFLMGEYDVKEHKDSVEEALAAAKGSSWVSVPAGCRVEAISLALRGTTDFESAIEKLDREIETAVNGAILQSMEGAKTGSYASAKVHGGTSDLRVWFLSDVLSSTMNDQAVPDMVDLNFTSENAELDIPGFSDYPCVSFGGVNDEDLKASLEIDTGLTNMGVKISKKSMYARYKRKAPVDADDVFEPAAPPPIFGMNGGVGISGPAALSNGQQRPGVEQQDAPDATAGNGLLSTVGGAANLTQLQQAYTKGEMDRTAALNAATIIYGLDRVSAEKLFPPNPAVEPQAQSPPGGAAQRPFDRRSAFAEHRFSSTQLEFSTGTYALAGPELLRMAAAVADDDLVEDGRENEPHITVKFGLHTNQPDLVAQIVRGFGLVRIRLGETSLFQNADADVVKVDIISDDLHRLHTLIAGALPNTETHPTYKPHATIAYVKPGRGAKYVGKNPLTGYEMEFSSLVFSDPDRVKFTIDLLKPQRQFAERDTKADKQVDSMLSVALKQGQQTLEEICRSAFQRRVQVGHGSKNLFTTAERDELTQSLTEVMATARLLGRARVQQLLEARKRGRRFSEHYFDESRFRPMAPERAVEYFKSLFPRINEDVARVGPLLQRQAFTMAVATEQALLEKVQATITEGLRGTESSPTRAIEALLDEAGVSSRNPQYAEMVYRTNAMDAYTTGHEEERMQPEVLEAFPVWRWDTAGDNRVRPTHEAREGKYYPGDVSFQEVRGTEAKEVINDRCVPTPIYVDDWVELRRQGYRVETNW